MRVRHRLMTHPHLYFWVKRVRWFYVGFYSLAANYTSLHHVYVTTLNQSWWGSSDEGNHVMCIDNQRIRMELLIA